MKIFETSVSLTTVHDDLVVEFYVKPGATLQASDVWESAEACQAYIPNTKFFILFYGASDVEVVNEARRAVTSAEFSKYAAALAIFSESVVHKIIGSLFIKVNKPKIPTKFFDNKDNAIAWLKNQQKTQ